MASLVLGPLVRHVGERDATVWVQTDERCTVEVLGHRVETFCVAGRHYALVVVEGLAPGSATPYEVTLDGARVWPRDDGWPASSIRTNERGAPITIGFGSCRVSVPHEPPHTLRKDDDPRGREHCALRALAMRLRDSPPETWPGALLMLGDQIYADEVNPRTRAWIRERRDVSIPPGEELAGLEEYMHAYGVAWSEPAIRWLLSTVPTSMIFDDHDVIDDWNTSFDWVKRMRAHGWWDERIVGGFASYWIYQHIGNLSPESLASDEVYARVCDADDAELLLREFAWRSDRAVDSVRWSFCRDLGPARLIMIDSRAGRILDPGGRSMVDDEEWDFIASNAVGHRHDHVLLGTSLPWLLAPGMHHLEAWSEAVCEGAWGRTAGRAGEALRQALDLEHWGAFRDAFDKLCGVVADIGCGREGPPPATVVALSGDVHHAYLAEVDYPAAAEVRSNVYQAVCSPFRNPLDGRERRIMRTMASGRAAKLTRALARAAGVRDPDISWRLRNEPIFDNVVATLRLEGRDARLRIERTRFPDATLETAFEARL